MERLWGLKPGARAPRPDGAGLLARFRLHAGCCCETHDLTSHTGPRTTRRLSLWSTLFTHTLSGTPYSTIYQNNPGLATGVTEEYSVTLV